MRRFIRILIKEKVYALAGAVIALSLLSIVLGAVLVHQNKKLEACLDNLGSIPLRKDYRRMTVVAFTDSLATPEKQEMILSPDGKSILTIHADDGFMETRIISHQKRGIIAYNAWFGGTGVPISAAAFSPDGSQVVSAHTDGSVRVWNARNGSEREVLHWEGSHIDDIYFTSDGSGIIATDSSASKMCRWGPFSWMI